MVKRPIFTPGRCCCYWWRSSLRLRRRARLVYSFWENWETGSSTADATRDGFGTVIEQELNDMRSLLREMRFDAIPHTSRSLMDHVDGVYQILCNGNATVTSAKRRCFTLAWGRPCCQPVADEQIDRIRTLIGERAMFLLMLYSRTDLPSLRRIVSGDKFTHSGGTGALSLRDTRSLSLWFGPTFWIRAATSAC